MEAFEKWDKRNKLNYGQFSGGEFSVKNERRKGWKAALEWFYDQLGYSQEHEELKDVIEKELEGE